MHTRAPCRLTLALASESGKHSGVLGSCKSSPSRSIHRSNPSTKISVGLRPPAAVRARSRRPRRRSHADQPQIPGPGKALRSHSYPSTVGYRTVSPRLHGRGPPSRELVRMRPEVMAMVTEPRGCHTISRSLVAHSPVEPLPAPCGLELTAPTTESRTGRKSGSASTTETELVLQRQPAQVGSIGPISRSRTRRRSTPHGACRPQ